MTATQIQPLGNRVLVKRSKMQASKGGILLPETAKEKPKQGEVIAVGPGKCDAKGDLQKMSLNVGDNVLFSSYGGTEVKMGADDQEEYLILSEEDVLGVLI